MCGITGILFFDNRPDSRRLVSEMVRVMHHRGPDDQGYYNDGSLSLGFCRLSIIDVAGGHQPMSNEDGSVWLVFNGEIYNHADLRSDLVSRGHVFQSRSDSEVIVHAYEEYGADCVHKFHGMFAFAVWDCKKQELFVARDRLGIKPLYYAYVPGVAFLFASEAKALLQSGLIAPDANLQALNYYMTFLWVPDPHTMFKGIQKLSPGHYLKCSDGRVDVRQYWDLAFNSEGPCSEKDWEIRIRESLQSAVKSHLQSEVPLGALLSGGLDSSSVVALMSEMVENPVTTYTIGFREEDIRGDVLMNELPYAREVGRIFDTEYNEIILKPDTIHLLPKLVWHMDEPIADPAAIATFLICQAAKAKLTVMLTGVGGDEIFAGYPRHVGSLYAQQYRRIPAFLRRGIIDPAALALPVAGPLFLRSAIRNLKKFTKSASLPFQDAYLGFGTYFDGAEKRSLLSPELNALFNGADPYQHHREYFGRVKNEHPIDQMLYVDLKTFLPCLNLTYMDKMSMASSIELRVPFLDDSLVDLLSHVPPGLKIKGNVRKYILRKVAEGLLPKRIVWRKKAGFGAPIGSWLKTDLKEMILDLMSESTVGRRGYFNYAEIQKLVKGHYSGFQYNASQLWQLLTLEIWHRVFIDRTMSV